MAHNRRTVSKIEFNKRIRDLVSRDSNRLRQTFQKFDKECASRLAEIQSMQEKVRHSMRNLAQDKLQSQLSSATEHDLHLKVKESETERGKSSVPGQNVAHQVYASDNRAALTPEERRRTNNKIPLPDIPYTHSEYLKVPNSGESRSRRHSLPHRPTFLPGSPKETHTFLRSPVASSLPKETFVIPGSQMGALINYPSSPKQSARGIPLQQHRNGYRLSIHDLPISLSRSDNLPNIRVKKSPQLVRKGRKTPDSNKNCNKDDLGAGNDCAKEDKSKQESSTKTPRSNSDQLDGVIETESRRGSDPKSVKSKTLVKRTRSSSLPVDPAMLLHSRDFKPKEIQSSVSISDASADHTAGCRHESHWVVNKDDDDVALTSFEELRQCRYLRSGDADA